MHQMVWELLEQIHMLQEVFKHLALEWRRKLANIAFYASLWLFDGAPSFWHAVPTYRASQDGDH